MTAQSTISALQSGLALIEALAPVVASLGGQGAEVANIASSLATIGQAALNTYEGLSATDAAHLSDLTLALQAKNDELAAAIAAS